MWLNKSIIQENKKKKWCDKIEKGKGKANIGGRGTLCQLYRPMYYIILHEILGEFRRLI